MGEEYIELTAGNKEISFPTVSIILPTYNGSKYLREAINSILAQTMQDWELIAVDDCSTDNSLQILHEYAARDSRIFVIHNEINQRLPRALNIGFQQARGKYLTWTSDDNIYKSTALRVMSDYLGRHHDAFMVYGGMSYIDAEGTVIGIHPQEEPFVNLLHNVVGACFMYRKEILSDVGEYDTQLFCAEDYDYWLRIMKRHKIVRIDDMLYLYRQHSASLTATKIAQVKRQVGKTKEKHIDFLIMMLKEQPRELFRLFWEYIDVAEPIENYIVERFKKILPMLQGVLFGAPHQELVIFGAGKMGSNAAKFLQERAIAFADNDSTKVGTEKDGLPIISFEEMVHHKAEIVIAAGLDKSYDMMEQLAEAGIRKYWVWQTLEGRLHK